MIKMCPTWLELSPPGLVNVAKTGIVFALKVVKKLPRSSHCKHHLPSNAIFDPGRNAFQIPQFERNMSQTQLLMVKHTPCRNWKFIERLAVFLELGNCQSYTIELVDFSIEHSDFPQLCQSLPEHNIRINKEATLGVTSQEEVPSFALPNALKRSMNKPFCSWIFLALPKVFGNSIFRIEAKRLLRLLSCATQTEPIRINLKQRRSLLGMLRSSLFRPNITLYI